MVMSNSSFIVFFADVIPLTVGKVPSLTPDQCRRLMSPISSSLPLGVVVVGGWMTAVRVCSKYTF